MQRGPCSRVTPAEMPPEALHVRQQATKPAAAGRPQPLIHSVEYLPAAAEETDCAANLVRQEEESVEEAGPDHPNAMFPAVHLQLRQLAQHQLAEAPRESAR